MGFRQEINGDDRMVITEMKCVTYGLHETLSNFEANQDEALLLSKFLITAFKFVVSLQEYSGVL